MNRFKKLLVRFVFALWELTILITLSVYYYLEAIIIELTPTFMRTQKSLRDKVVIITGGAGGVGQELVIRLARIQARVVVWDINKEAIQKLHARCDKEGFKIYSYVVDISDRNNVYKNAKLVKNEVGAVDIVINNAGIVSGYTLLDIPDQFIEKSFQVNIISQYWMAKAFLGDMLKKGQGHIISIGSVTGLLGTYKCTDYSATKYALIGLHESLLTELKSHGHNNIHVTLICPYFINTGMFDGCKPRNMSMLDPKDVAKRIIEAVMREEVFVTMPGFIRFLIPIKQYIPAKLNWLIMNRIFRGPQSMMGMKNLETRKAYNLDVVAA